MNMLYSVLLPITAADNHIIHTTGALSRDEMEPAEIRFRLIRYGIVVFNVPLDTL